MNRRTALAWLLASQGLASLVADAAPVRRAGVLIFPGEAGTQWVRPRLQALKALGWTDQRLTVAVRQPEDKDVEKAAAELAGMDLHAILTQGTPLTLALRRATKRIPIITALADPVASGLARSLRASGTNVTGLAYLDIGEEVGKSLEAMRSIVPAVSRVGVFYRATWHLPDSMWDAIRAVARRMGIAIIDCPVGKPGDTASALDRLRVGAPAAAHSLTSGVKELATLAMERRLPLSVPDFPDVEAGALLSYRLTYSDEPSRFAGVADRILRGSDPATVPFELPTVSRLAVNLATARALGLAVPYEVLLRADRVIE